MKDPEVGAVIVRHIDEIEAALKYADETMEPQLGKAVAELGNDWLKKHEWAGETEDDLGEEFWVASKEWQMEGESKDSFDLYANFDSSVGPNDFDPSTWIANFAGFLGAGIHFTFETDALNKNPWKSLLKTETILVDELLSRGFQCDLKSGELAMPISIDRETLAEAFQEEDFEEALKPIEKALDNMLAAKDVLDKLVEAIRKNAK